MNTQEAQEKEKELRKAYDVNVDESGKHYQVAKVTLFNLFLCTDETDTDKMEDWLAKHSPAGTTRGWRASTEREDFCVQCADHKERKHYVFAA